MNGTHSYSGLGTNKGTCSSREISNCPHPLTSLSTIQFYLRNLDPNVTPAPPSLANMPSFSQLFVSSRLSHPRVASLAHSFSLLSDNLQPHIPAPPNHCAELCAHALAWHGNPEAYCSYLWQELLSKGDTAGDMSPV